MLRTKSQKTIALEHLALVPQLNTIAIAYMKMNKYDSAAISINLAIVELEKARDAVRPVVRERDAEGC